MRMSKAPVGTWKKRILQIFFVLVIGFIAYDVFHAITLPIRVEVYVRAHPGLYYRHLGPCGTPAVMAMMDVDPLTLGVPPHRLVPLLAHRAAYIRGAARYRLQRMKWLSLPSIYWYGYFGNPRLKLQLLNSTPLYPGMNRSSNLDKKLQLLDQVIQDRNLPVFYDDYELVKQYRMTNGCDSVDDYPFDILTFYVRLMNESDFPTDQTIAAWELGQFGSEAVDTIPDILNLLNQPDEEISPWGFGTPDGTETSMHGWVIIVLAEIGVDSPEAISTLEAVYQGQYPILSVYAAGSLYKLGHRQDEIIENLMTEFNTGTNDNAKVEIIRTLRRMGVDTNPLIPDLLEFTADSEEWIRRDVTSLICQPGNSLESIMDTLIEELGSDDEAVLKEAIHRMWFLQSRDISAAIPSLVNLLDKVEGTELHMICKILIARDEHLDLVLDAIIRNIEDNTQFNHDLAALLPEFGSDADRAIPALKTMIESGDTSRIHAGSRVYKEIGGDPDYLVRQMIQNLDHPDHSMVNAAITILRDMGPDASDALPKLESMIERSSDQDRLLIQDAIDAINGTN